MDEKRDSTTLSACETHWANHGTNTDVFRQPFFDRLAEFATQAGHVMDRYIRVALQCPPTERAVQMEQYLVLQSKAANGTV